MSWHKSFASASFKKKTKPKARGIPWRLVGVSILGAAIAAVCLWKVDDIDRLARKIEIDFLGGVAHAEDLKPAKAAEAKSEDKKTEEAPIAKRVQSGRN